jgi:hypothetical protein
MLVVYPKLKKDDLTDQEISILRECLNKTGTKTRHLR